MKRTHVSLAGLATLLALGLPTSQTFAADAPRTATVSFGTWMSSPPLDRFPNTSDTRFRNNHAVSPYVVKIMAGGTVRFIVSGLHNIIVYDRGTRPENIDVTQVVNTTGTPTVPIINDANNRIYRGLDPTLQAVDRVENVQFDQPGLYLVICGLRPHFTAGMYGYVQVMPDHESVVP